MQVANIAVWDLETGGLSKTKSAVVEIALIILDSVTLKEIDRYEAIIAPYSVNIPREDKKGNALDENSELCSKSNLPQFVDKNVPVDYNPKALEYNGITMSQINGGKEAKVVAKEVAAILKKHKKPIRFGNGIVIGAGHNLHKFDVPFLKFFLSNFGVKYEEILQDYCFDTMWMTRMNWPDDGAILNHKLGTACEKVGIELIDAHKAMNDVEGNAKLLSHFLMNMRQKGTSVINQVQEKTRAKFKF